MGITRCSGVVTRCDVLVYLSHAGERKTSFGVMIYTDAQMRALMKVDRKSLKMPCYVEHGKNYTRQNCPRCNPCFCPMSEVTTTLYSCRKCIERMDGPARARSFGFANKFCNDHFKDSKACIQCNKKAHAEGRLTGAFFCKQHGEPKTSCMGCSLSLASLGERCVHKTPVHVHCTPCRKIERGIPVTKEEIDAWTWPGKRQRTA